MGHPALNLDDLTPEEQLQLLEDLWDLLSERPANLPLSDEQRAELYTVLWTRLRRTSGRAALLAAPGQRFATAFVPVEVGPLHTGG